MKKVAVLLVTLALAQLAFAQTWNNVSLIDSNCATRAKADPDAHTRACALKCSKAGYGVITADGDFLKFDAAGNAKAAELLKSTDKTDHLRVNVTGERQGDQLNVKSISLM